MIRILELRPNPISKSNGIDKYCQSLRLMFESDIEICILPVTNLPMKRTALLKEMYDRKCLKSIVNDKSIDIVHINGFATFSVIQSFWYAKKAGKKIVYTAHWHPFKYLNHPFRAKVFYSLLLKPLIKRYADVVVTINDEDTSFFKKIHKNVKQIPHWIDSSQLSCSPKRKDSSMILFVGRVDDSNKGAEHLFYLPEGKYKIHCVGPCNGKLRSDMTSHINIPSEELWELYSRASLLVVPSRYEAFSYATLEALSFGTPVLLSERVRIYDYLKGIEGVSVFNFQDYEEFRHMVASQIGVSVNKDAVLSIFSIERIKEKYKDVFTSIL